MYSHFGLPLLVKVTAPVVTQQPRPKASLEWDADFVAFALLERFRRVEHHIVVILDVLNLLQLNRLTSRVGDLNQLDVLLPQGQVLRVKRHIVGIFQAGYLKRKQSCQFNNC